jgi:hypothetical protein
MQGGGGGGAQEPVFQWGGGGGVRAPNRIFQPTFSKMGVTEIILAKSPDFVSCRITVVGFFLGYRFFNP